MGAGPDLQLMRECEVAQMIGVTPRTVRNLLADGRLPRVKVGRCTRIPRAAIAALVGGAVLVTRSCC